VSTKHLHIITGLLTGHVALNRQLTVTNIRTDPLCLKCREEEETAYHFLGRCSAMMLARYSVLVSYLMDITELQQVQPYTLLRFAKALKRFIYPFGYLGAAHWTETDYGLSAGQHAILPKGKGKGKVCDGTMCQHGQWTLTNAQVVSHR